MGEDVFVTICEHDINETVSTESVKIGYPRTNATPLIDYLKELEAKINKLEEMVKNDGK